MLGSLGGREAEIWTPRVTKNWDPEANLRQGRTTAAGTTEHLFLNSDTFKETPFLHRKDSYNHYSFQLFGEKDVYTSIQNVKCLISYIDFLVIVSPCVNSLSPFESILIKLTFFFFVLELYQICGLRRWGCFPRVLSLIPIFVYGLWIDS